MKSKYTELIAGAMLASSLACLHARVVTLQVGPNVSQSEISIGTNEVAEVLARYRGGTPGVGSLDALLIKDGVTNVLYLPNYDERAALPPVAVAGPAVIRLSNKGSTETGWCTVKVEPESFPPDKTVILPEGTVGTIHVESSTNLVQWADEWVHTFSNTNENRFFRIRADRVLP